MRPHACAQGLSSPEMGFERRMSSMPAWRLVREPAHVEEVHDTVRRVEHPELGPVRREREPVSRRVGPEARVPGEALEARDVELLLRAQVEDTDAEQPALRLVGDAVLAVLDAATCRTLSGRPARATSPAPERAHRPGGASDPCRRSTRSREDHDLVAMRSAVCRRPPGARLPRRGSAEPCRS